MGLEGKNLSDFRERGWKREKHQCERETLTFHMLPDQGLNLQPFGLWDDAQPTKPHTSQSWSPNLNAAK